MYEYMMTVDMYDLMCVLENYVVIEIHTCAKVALVFTMTLMYCNVMEEKI